MAAAPISRIDIHCLRAPIAAPVVNAFGRMDARQAVVLRVEDRDGAYGWGEVWCNYPNRGGVHRANLLESTIGRWYLGRNADDPRALTSDALRHFHLMAIQCNEPGPFAQGIAGLDLALWDLYARRRGLPLATALGGDPRPLPAYASGVNPTEPLAEIARARDAGYRHFKLKIGIEGDNRNLDAVTKDLRSGETLFVDANQGYDVETARRRLPELAAMGVGWIEEPVPADTPFGQWEELARLSSAPLAGGENITHLEDFARFHGVLGVIQPDLAKWGGHSLCREVARAAMAAGRRFCPHYLGGGIGLLHSAHLLSAMGGDGLLEVDNNPNPLREALIPLPSLDPAGRWPVTSNPGLGTDPDAAVIHEFAEVTHEVA